MAARDGYEAFGWWLRSVERKKIKKKVFDMVVVVVVGYKEEEIWEHG